MSMYSLFLTNKAHKSVSPVTLNEDISGTKSTKEQPTILQGPPHDQDEQHAADKQDPADKRVENGYVSSQRRLSLTDLQNEAIYAFGARLSVISETSKEEASVNNSIQPSLATEEEESGHTSTQQDGNDEPVASASPRYSCEERTVALNQDKIHLRDILDKSLQQLELSNLHLTVMDLKDICNLCPGLTRLAVRDCTLDRDALLQFLPRSIKVLDLSHNAWVTHSWLMDLLGQHLSKSDDKQRMLHVHVSNCASLSRTSISRLNLEYQGRAVLIQSTT